jgi:hypothetical protein
VYQLPEKTRFEDGMNKNKVSITFVRRFFGVEK